MRLIQQTSEYAIRALTYLAQRHGQGYLLVRELGAALDLPVPYLAKVLQPLVGRGLLESQRGRGGGYRLAREPRSVRLYDVVDAVEPLGGPRRCLLGQADCSDERACPLHELWKSGSDAFLARLRSTTLADVLAFCERAPQSGYPVRQPGG